MNNPPFHIGQKVVYIDKSNHVHKKDKVYTVHQNGQCNKCGEWHTSTLETFEPVPPGMVEILYCTFCDGVVNLSGGYYGTDSKSFAPIQTNYADATAEILEKFPQVSETPDKILKPEPINQC